MALDFPGHADAMRHTLRVAERCNVERQLGRIARPSTRRRKAEGVRLPRQICERPAKPTASRRGLNERLQYEIKTIKEMGFTDYFHIVWDFIHFARGTRSVSAPAASAAGSLVAYCLEITDIDPIRYDLPVRALPQQAASRCPTWTSTSPSPTSEASSTTSPGVRRDRRRIITFSTMAARAPCARRPRARIPYGAVDKIAKLIPEGPDARRMPQARQRAAKTIDSIPSPRRSSSSQPLEGLTRADSIRRGVVFNAEPLMSIVPLRRRPRPGSHPVPGEGHRGAQPAEDGLPRLANLAT
jgi:DNA polymerase-3 subunit alpha